MIRAAASSSSPPLHSTQRRLAASPLSCLSVDSSQMTQFRFGTTHGHLWRVAEVKASPQHLRAYQTARIIRPVHQRPRLTPRRHKPCGCSIPRLLPAGRPATVVRTISSRVVDAVDSEVISISGGNSPSTKPTKGLPFFADRNAGAPISVVRDMRGVGASPKHCSPQRVNTRVGICPFGMNSIVLASNDGGKERLGLVGSTRRCIAVSQPFPGHRSSLAAITEADPRRALLNLVGRKVLHDKFAKAKARKINQFGHSGMLKQSINLCNQKAWKP